MNLPHIRSYEDQAIEMVTYVLNKAREKLGDRLTLMDIRDTRNALCKRPRLTVKLTPPVVLSAEKFITDTIRVSWKLTDVLQYDIRYLQHSFDPTSKYYYFEVVFSQPTPEYPIPQTTVSVFFRLQVYLLEQNDFLEKQHPKITFRIEGHHQDHDVRYVKLTVDWILATMKMKINYFSKIENFLMF